MPKDAFYFKHDSNAQADLKHKALRKHYGWEGYGWFWLLIELLRNEETYKLEYSQFTFDALAGDMNCSPDKVKEFIDYCISPVKLFEKNGSHFYSPRLLRDMAIFETVREQKRQAGIKSGEKRLGFNTRLTAKEQALNTRSTGVQLRKGKVRKGKVSNKKVINKEIIIPEWIDKELWDSFLEMRKKKQASPTARAIELLIKELEKLKGQGNDPNEILKQSIMRNYTGVFPLKEGAKDDTARTYRGNPSQKPGGAFDDIE